MRQLLPPSCCSSALYSGDIGRSASSPSTSYDPSPNIHQRVRRRSFKKNLNRLGRRSSTALQCYCGRQLTLQTTKVGSGHQGALKGQHNPITIQTPSGDQHEIGGPGVSSIQHSGQQQQVPQHFQEQHGIQLLSGAIVLDKRQEVLHQIADVKSIGGLRRITHALLPTLDEVQLKWALQRIAALVPESETEQQARQACLEDICYRLKHVVQHYSAADLCAVACTLAKLRYYDGQLLQQIMGISWQLIPNMSGRGAAGLLWAFARFHKQYKVPVSPDWVDAILAQVASQRKRCSAASLSQTLFALGLLEHRPSEDWMQQHLQHIQVHMSEFQGHNITQMMWALAKLNVQPGQEWLGATLARAEASVRTFSDGGMLSFMLWSLAVLRHRPSGPWMQHFMWQVQRRLNQFSASNMSVALWALAALQYRPESRWRQEFLRLSLQRLARPSVSPQTYANMLYALAKLKITPRGTWLRTVARSMLAQLPLFTPRDLAHVLWSLQQLEWMEVDLLVEITLVVKARLRQFDVPCLVMTLAALGRYRSMYKAEDSLVQSICAQLAPHVARLSVDNLAAVAVAAANLEVQLERPLHEQLLQQTDRHMQGLSMRNLASMAWALCTLAPICSDVHLRHGLQLLPRLAQTVASKGWEHCNYLDLSQLVVGFAKVGYSPSDTWLGAHEAAVVQQVARGSLSDVQLKPLLQGYDAMGYQPHRLQAIVRSRRGQAAMLSRRLVSLGGSHSSGSLSSGSDCELDGSKVTSSGEWQSSSSSRGGRSDSFADGEGDDEWSSSMVSGARALQKQQEQVQRQPQHQRLVRRPARAVHLLARQQRPSGSPAVQEPAGSSTAPSATGDGVRLPGATVDSSSSSTTTTITTSDTTTMASRRGSSSTSTSSLLTTGGTNRHAANELVVSASSSTSTARHDSPPSNAHQRPSRSHHSQLLDSPPGLLPEHIGSCLQVVHSGNQSNSNASDLAIAGAIRGDGGAEEPGAFHSLRPLAAHAPGAGGAGDVVAGRVQA